MERSCESKSNRLYCLSEKQTAATGISLSRLSTICCAVESSSSLIFVVLSDSSTRTMTDWSEDTEENCMPAIARASRMATAECRTAGSFFLRVLLFFGILSSGISIATSAGMITSRRRGYWKFTSKFFTA